MRILLDVDGPIVDFAQWWLKLACDALGRLPWECDRSVFHMEDRCKLFPEDRERMLRALHTADNSRAPATPGAIEGIRELQKEHKLYFITTSLTPHQTWDHDRRQWFKDKLGPTLADRLIFCECKSVIPGDIFVDDRPRNCLDWSAHNRDEAILFGDYFNGGEGDIWNGKRAAGWEQLLECIKAKHEGRRGRT